MYFPLTQTFNFFDDIFSLIELAKKQDFIKFENQTWPGKRTLSISQLNFNLQATAAAGRSTAVPWVSHKLLNYNNKINY